MQKCVLCAGEQFVIVFRKNSYDISRCAGCGCIQVSPMPSQAQLIAHYQDPSYFEGEEEQGYKSYADTRKALQPFFARRLREIREHKKTGKTLLDFGCADGFFLELAQSEGWDIHGVELSRQMAEKAARALNISIQSDLDLDVTANLDVITLWEVIEHLPDPVHVLIQLRSKMAPGGLLMLSTPNNGHWQPLRDPANWTVYRPPSHLIYFTRDSLLDSLMRAGFEKIEIKGVSPLPPLPDWLRRLSEPLRAGVIAGQSKHWQMSLLLWRVVRIAGLVWQKIAFPKDDVQTTLEATAVNPG